MRVIGASTLPIAGARVLRASTAIAWCAAFRDSKESYFWRYVTALARLVGCSCRRAILQGAHGCHTTTTLFVRLDARAALVRLDASDVGDVGRASGLGEIGRERR